MKRKIYFAGPWFTEQGMNTMCEAMRIVGSVNDITNYSVYFPLANQGGTPKEVFHKDISAVRTCDIVVALVDEKDSGTAWELGLGYALGKDIVLIASNEEAFHKRTNLMLAFSAEKCILLNQFANYLTDRQIEVVNIENIWEGKGYSG